MDDDKALWPIIYVRGFAMTRGEIDDTTADPFCGFNLGSTVYRAVPDKKAPPQKFVFESPVVRLGTDYGYTDVFDNGLDIVDAEWKESSIPVNSIVIYRYYDSASRILGTAETPPIEKFAEGLSELVLKVRDLVCADPRNKVARKDFRCYLVAHSMGGLVCRTFLQNEKHGSDEARRCVDKVFTYATPHNGIDVLGINVPKWLTPGDMSNFSRERMAKYLDLKALYKGDDPRVDWLPEKAFPSERFFCLIGTNRADYEVAMGLSRTFAGHGSDGLVKIENASVWGVGDKGELSVPCATAYVYRSHSGYYGIVNGEESYQNLVRFLFGDVRVDLWLDVTAIRPPADVQEAIDKKREVNALYQFEVMASPRGKRWYLTRRVAEEDSVACRTLPQLLSPRKPTDRTIFLSTVFLDKRWRINPRRDSLAYGITLGVRVPDYEIEGRFWGSQHYEGGYLFRDAAVVELFPLKKGGGWRVTHFWQSNPSAKTETEISPKALDGGKVELRMEFENKNAPAISGRLRLIVGGWNSTMS